jgi:hypothetical protein
MLTITTTADTRAKTFGYGRAEQVFRAARLSIILFKEQVAVSVKHDKRMKGILLTRYTPHPCPSPARGEGKTTTKNTIL